MLRLGISYNTNTRTMNIILSEYHYKLCLWSAFIFTSLLRAQSIGVCLDPTNIKQHISIIGGDMERSANAIRNSTNKDQIIQWGFKEINFNVCRVQFDKNQELTKGKYNFEFYEKQVLTMQDIKSVNSGIQFWATPRTDYDGFGNKNNMPDWIVNYHTKAVIVKNYAKFLVDYLEHMHNNGVSIGYLSICKEWTSYVTPQVEAEIIPLLIEMCRQKQIQMPKIVGPASWSISAGITFVNKLKNLGVTDYYEGFSSHNYRGESKEKWETFIDLSNSLGKHAWDDETSSGAGGPIWGEEPDMSIPLDVYRKRCESYEKGLEGEIFFEIWSRGINRETRAIYFKSGGEGRRMRSYYMMKQFSNLTLHSDYINHRTTGLSDQVYTMAFKKDNKVSLWVVNDTDQVYSDFDIGLYSDSESMIADRKVNLTYWNNDTDIIGVSQEIKTQTRTFKATIYDKSISCFEFLIQDNDCESSFISEQSSDNASNQVSFKVEAENYCQSSETYIFNSTVASGSLFLGSFNSQDWLGFQPTNFDKINSLSVSYATGNTESTLSFYIDQMDQEHLHSSVVLPSTTDDYVFNTVTVHFPMLSGEHSFYIKSSGDDGFNLDYVEFSFDESLNLSNINQVFSNNIEVVPTIFKDQINFSNIKYPTHLSIFNVEGLKVYDDVLYPSVQTIDLNQLSSGIYFVFLESQGSYFIKKLVKK